MSTNARPVFLRVVAAVALLGVWVGLTATTRADPAGARPGMSTSVSPLPQSLPKNASARQLARLLAATDGAPSAKGLHTVLKTAADQVGLDLPEADAEEDSAHDAHDIPVKFARQGLRLSAALTRDALKAPQDQAAHLLAAAEEIDDASRSLLRAKNSTAPENSGVASALGLSSTRLTALTQTDKAALASGLKSTSCSAGHDDASKLPGAVAGFAHDPVAAAKAASSRAATFHEAGVEAGRLAYAARVIGQRQGSTQLLEQAGTLDDLVSDFQSVMPQDCDPIATTSVGATKSLTEAGSTLTQADSALADRLRAATASMPAGASRKSLATLWWQVR